MQNQIGIESIAVHVPRHFIDLADVAEANGVDPAKYQIGLGVNRMAVAGHNEDAMTMAVAAARRLMSSYEIDPGSIGLVIVGTETGTDEAKPIASYVHRFLNLPTSCRVFDTKHACYGTTAALRMACDWCLSRKTRLNGGRKALVVATDIAKYEVGSAGEPTQGAGAVAMLVGTEPRILALDNVNEALYAEEVMDFWRPHYRNTALADGHESIKCYLKALGHTYGEYSLNTGLALQDYNYLLFHVPFPKMAYKGFKLLHEREVKAGGGNGGMEADFEARVRPAIWANSEIGNVYSGSLYMSLAGLLEREGEMAAGTRLGLFSYGSGSCAEFFSGEVGFDSDAWRGKTGLISDLENRVKLDYREYLEFRRVYDEQSFDGSFDPDLVPLNDMDQTVSFLGVQNHRRVYRDNFSPSTRLQAVRETMKSASPKSADAFSPNIFRSDFADSIRERP